jgi:hypothetical protein
MAIAEIAVVSTGTKVQVDPAALPLDFVVILGRAAWRRPEQRCCFKDGVCDVAGSVLEEAPPDRRAVIQPQPTTVATIVAAQQGLAGWFWPPIVIELGLWPSIGRSADSAVSSPKSPPVGGQCLQGGRRRRW